MAVVVICDSSPPLSNNPTLIPTGHLLHTASRQRNNSEQLPAVTNTIPPPRHTLTPLTAPLVSLEGDLLTLYTKPSPTQNQKSSGGIFKPRVCDGVAHTSKMHQIHIRCTKAHEEGKIRETSLKPEIPSICRGICLVKECHTLQISRDVTSGLEGDAVSVCEEHAVPVTFNSTPIL
ncbi:hypothetical protein BaRGS_00038997 [Batillaria attramentaria]|uniref:Uncharacterized protein n=1 Tax=Batillaria attramentaria TaxID=370345 RepID=A0ABD0J4V8_9CAEN